MAAYAQTTGGSAFGEQLSELSWSTWKWVFMFCMLGSIVRLLMDLKRGKIRQTFFPRLIDIVTIIVVGHAAGFIVFVACEYINQKAEGRVIPDLATCGLMFGAAINKEAVYSWFTSKFGAALGAVVNQQQK